MMDSQNPLQIESQNLENPQKNPPEKAAETEKHRKKAANMEKFKEAVMKLLNIEGNSPSSETHKALIQDRVTQFISRLHSPDHPPYAWMIEGALRELNERGGSSVDSISKFIGKEYDDLPWAHYTMLKYHLVQLCESGELVMTREQRYLLADGNSDLKIRKRCRRKPVKRKRGWDWDKKQSKQHRKESGTLNMSQKGVGAELLFSQQKDPVTSNEVYEEEGCMVEGNEQQKLKGDEDELLSIQQKIHGTSNEIHEEEECMVEGGDKEHKLKGNDTQVLSNQRNDQVTLNKVHDEKECMVERVAQPKLNGDNIELLLSQPKSQGTSSEVHEEEDLMIQVIEQQKLEAEVRKDTERLYCAGENGVSCNSDAPHTVPSSLLITDGKDNLQKLTVQLQSSDTMAGITDICNQNAHLKQGEKQLKDNQTELPSPEGPPGFEYVTLEEVSHFQCQAATSSKLSIHPEWLKEDASHSVHGKPTAPALSDIEESCSTEHMQRQIKCRNKRLSGQPASLISDILPSAESQEACPPKPELSDQDRGLSEHQKPVESTQVREVQGKISIQPQRNANWQKSCLDLSETLEQPNLEKLSMLPCLERYPAESKENERERQVAKGAHLCRVLRPRLLKPEPKLSKTTAMFPSSLDQHEGVKPESRPRGRPPKAKPDIKVTNGLRLSIHENKEDLFPEGPKCEPSKGATMYKLLPKHHYKKNQQLGLRGRGRPPKFRRPVTPEHDTLMVGDITPPKDRDQKDPENPTQPLIEKLDITTEQMSPPKSDHNPHMEQQLEELRHQGHGRHPKHNSPSTIMKSKSQLKTKYRGLGRPRKTDRGDW